jgi:hypothetical protein
MEHGTQGGRYSEGQRRRGEEKGEGVGTEEKEIVVGERGGRERRKRG